MQGAARAERSHGARDLFRGDAYVRNEDGELVAGEAQDRQSVGAAAFLHTDNPAMDDFMGRRRWTNFAQQCRAPSRIGNA